MIVPLIAVHLFVFYFGILADDTPPVGLAAFAAAGISGGDPIRTGIQGFTYDIRTAILPFMFIFNTELLMIGSRLPLHFIVVVTAAVIAMLVFAAATQGYWLTRNRIWETLGLLLVAFTLFRPGFFWDQVYPELTEQPADNLIQIVEQMEPGSQLRMELKGERMDGSEFTMVVMLPVAQSRPEPSAFRKSVLKPGKKRALSSSTMWFLQALRKKRGSISISRFSTSRCPTSDRRNS